MKISNILFVHGAGPVALLLLLFIGGCAGVGSVVPQVSAVHFRIAMTVEELRCKRGMELVMKLADARGDGWFTSYIGDCPNMQEFIRRAMNELKLVPKD